MSVLFLSVGQCDKIYGYDWDKLSHFPVIGENNAIFWVVYVIADVGLPLLGIELSKKKR